MKIAILEPYIGGFGGAQKVIGEYCTYLQKKGHSLEIFTQRYNPKEAYEEFKKLKINIISPHSKIFSPFAFRKKFGGFDKIIANDWPTHFASLKNRNVIWICYNPKRDFYDLKDFYFKNSSFSEKLSLKIKELLFKRIDKKAAEKCLKILPISKTIQKRIKLYYSLIPRKVFYCGINFDDYRQGNYEKYFLSISRLVKTKRINLIIEAMKKVKDKNVVLYIVGNGPEEKSLKEMAKNKPNVVFLGDLSEKKLKELYSNCLATVYVPKNEDWGLIPIEAAACKKPTIGVNEGGLRETIIDGKSGFLLTEASPEEIAKKIDLLSENKKFAKKMGQEAYKSCKKFDWKNILPEFERTIKN